MHAMCAAPSFDDGTAAIEFAGYLEAKFALDERSLNPAVRQACTERLAAKRGVVRWLDVGTGTGAMIRRLLELKLPASLAITALDQDAALLAIASDAIAPRLEREGYRVSLHSEGIEAKRSGQRVLIEFRCCGLFDFDPGTLAGYDLITAHAVMDIVPVKHTVSRFSAWLEHGGMLYASLNYDGDTALFPLYRDNAFEAAVLAEYNASMERRRVQGEATGGARSGRRVHAALCDARFSVVAYGSSDWDITPREGRYRDRDDDVLSTLLAWIRGESEGRPGIDADRLARWYAERRTQIENRELGMIVHQLDVLAVLQRPGFTAFT